MQSKTLVTQKYLSGAKPLKESQKKAATIVSFLLIPLSGLITDMYIPSMPHMATELHQSENAIQLTLTLFLISYGIAQFITGSLIDSYGRYRLTMISLIIFILSNLVIVATHNLPVIYAMRIVQGITTGFIVVAKRAFFVDVYEGDKRKHYLSLMSIVWSAAPVAAPFVGGYLQQYFNWQANFYVLAGYGVSMFLLEWMFSGETISEFRPLKFNVMWNDYKIMFRDKIFAFGIVVCGLCYGTTMIFGLSGAFIIEHQMGYSPVVAGYAALAMGLAWMCGGFIGRATIQKPFLPKLRLSNLLQIAITIVMIVTVTAISDIYTLVLFAFLVHVCVGFIFNNYFAFCLGRFPQMAGVVSGLSGGANFIITAVVSYTLIGFLHPVSQAGLGYAYLIVGLISFLIFQFLLRPFAKRVVLS